MKIFIRLALLICIFMLIETSSLAQTPDNNVSPEIISISYLPLSLTGMIKTTDNGNYLYNEGYVGASYILKKSTSDIVTGFSGGAKVVAGWSSNGQKFAIAYGTLSESYNLSNQIAVEIFDTAAEAKQTFYLPFQDVTEIAWSPFSNTQLFINETTIYDLSTNKQHQVGSTQLMNLNSIDYKVYGNYIWANNTQTPVASIKYLKVPVADSSGLRKAEFQMCTLDNSQCQTLINNITVIHSAVFGWDFSLTSNWMLWGGYEIPTSVDIEYSVQPQYRGNSILYLSDLSTGETIEIIRTSSLDLENISITNLSWSPDGATIVLTTSDMSLLEKRAPIIIELNWTSQ